MELTEEGIRADLTRFVARWSIRDGNERQEAALHAEISADADYTPFD